MIYRNLPPPPPPADRRGPPQPVRLRSVARSAQACPAPSSRAGAIHGTGAAPAGLLRTARASRLQPQHGAAAQVSRLRRLSLAAGACWASATPAPDGGQPSRLGRVSRLRSGAHSAPAAGLLAPSGSLAGGGGGGSREVAFGAVGGHWGAYIGRVGDGGERGRDVPPRAFGSDPSRIDPMPSLRGLRRYPFQTICRPPGARLCLVNSF